MDTIQKFQDLLKKLFQFETSDLDFGIYRILNYKREQIEKFIQEDLKKKVESAFARHKDKRIENINQRFEEAKQKVIEELERNAFTPTGDLKDEYKKTRVGKDYLFIKAQKDEAQTIDEIKIQVFNDLYSFFSRFYEEGDFVPQYRHSIKGHKYAIPYNGEEVKLYWANNEQYYTKTGLLFQDYTFKANDYKVIFRITSAREELGSKKATKQRFFILDDENPAERTEDKALIIRFQYRELIEEEVKSYDAEGGSNTAKQEKINQKSYDKILNKIDGIELKAFLSKEYKNERALLLYQILRFTAKNTKDYFIHKNLKKFFSEQLDYFTKAEVLDIETLEKERFLDKHIIRAKVVREIGEDIIDFLSQIEDFQKKLWEKKKFILKTEYVITTDRVPEELHQEIWANKDQKKEWRDLEFETTDYTDLHKIKLPVDTKYFSQNFKERLFEKLTKKTDLDDSLNGILIKSENWQALNLILEKYKEKIQCIYIDPPFNTGKDFLYKDKYRDSSWFTLLENRLSLAKRVLSTKGSFYLHLDPRANYYGRILMDSVFGKDNFINEIIWAYEKARYSEKKFKENHESLLLYSKRNDYLFKIQYVPRKGDETLKKRAGRYELDYEGKISPDYWVDIPSFSTAMTARERSVKMLGIYFETQKPEKLIKRVLETSSKESDIILDYFLGSGTTTAVAHKLGRKWIGVEMGDYFEDIPLKRMKIVLAGDKSGISREVNWQGGGFFKYHILEQYEDTLDNIELTSNKHAELKFGDDYILKYFLDYETRENPCLLNIDQLKKPFSYKLKVNLEEIGEPQEMIVDIPETFNYLLGLKIKKIKAREIASPSSRNDKRRKYLFVLGEKEGKDIAIVWREYDDNWNEDDFKEDKEFIIKELEPWSPHIVYVNGQSVLTPKLGKHTAEIRYVEPEFKNLMG